MALYERVRDRVHKYFNPDAFETKGFRETLLLGVMALCLGEVVVYILLRHSAEMGELPYYTTDALIIGVSSLEFLLCWFLGWLGSLKRRTMLVASLVLVLVCLLPGFALPDTETAQDSGLCPTTVPRSAPVGIPTKAAVRLAILLIFGVSCAVARLIVLAHGMAYLDELSPADNTYTHVGCFLLYRVLTLFVGYAVLQPFTVEMPWLQFLAISVKCLITLVKLYRYPVLPPGVDKELKNDRNLCSSLGRVLTNRVAMLQIIALALLAAGLWGFGFNNVDFAKVKFHTAEYVSTTPALIKMQTIILGVLLATYVYSGPVMPKFDMAAAVRTSILVSLFIAGYYCVITHWGNCNRGPIAGLGSLYSQPACGLNCGCDRPWIQYTPVCVNEQVTTYFSPCHAGCAMADTVNTVGVYTNCTCATGGRVTVGPCDDGSCAEAHETHQLNFALVMLTSMIAMAFHGAVLIQSVDPRDVSLAVGLASGIVSLFTFVGAHGFYLGISSFTCAFARGSKCLFHQESFVPWTGYTSATLAGGSALFSIVAFIVLKCKKQPKEDEEEDLTLS